MILNVILYHRRDFKADLTLVQLPNRKPYLITRHRKLERAIEYFEHNKQLTIQE
jgi:hypothetical protein